VAGYAAGFVHALHTADYDLVRASLHDVWVEPERAMFDYDERRVGQGLEPVFDLSEYAEFKDRMRLAGRNGKLGIFKDEYGDNRVVEEIALGKEAVQNST
jgi:hypothetical protein